MIGAIVETSRLLVRIKTAGKLAAYGYKTANALCLAATIHHLALEASITNYQLKIST